MKRSVLGRRKFFAIVAGVAVTAVTLTGISGGDASTSEPIRINAGGPAVTAGFGVVFQEDAYFSGGQTNRATYSIAGTAYDKLYQTERWGEFAYDIPVGSGTHTLKLHFAEINPKSGDRVFDVTAEGVGVVDDLNLGEQVGNYSAFIDQSSVTVKDGRLTLRFSATVNAAKLSAIEVIPGAGVSAPVQSTTTVKPTTTTAKQTTTTTTKPTTTTTAKPYSAGVATTSASVSGSAMPVGDLPGWKQIFKDDFATDVPVGRFPGSAYGAKWIVYDDGWPDTAGKNEGGIGRYYPSKVLSVQNGTLNKDLRVENGTALVAALMPKIPSYGQTYGRYTVRFRSDAVPGYKMAWLLWPDNENWNLGEIDFPEGDLDGTIMAFNHCIWKPQDNCFYADSGASFTNWRTATIEWAPGKLTYILDGRVLGVATDNVPTTSMHWVLQTETCMGNCQPAWWAKGRVQIDWVAMYSRA